VYDEASTTISEEDFNKLLRELGYQDSSYQLGRQDIYKNSNTSRSERGTVDAKRTAQTNQQIATIANQLKGISNFEERAPTEMNSVLQGFVEGECWLLYEDNPQELKRLFKQLGQTVSSIAKFSQDQSDLVAKQKH